MLGIGRQNQLVGLDIGSYAIKVAELSRKTKGGADFFVVKKLGYEILPRDAIVDGTIMDTAAVAETIRMIFDENRISTKNVVISISGNSVIIKKLSLPAMEKEELAESIFWEAKHSIPYPFEETNVDYAILPVTFGTGTAEFGYSSRCRQKRQNCQLHKCYSSSEQKSGSHRGGCVCFTEYN